MRSVAQDFKSMDKWEFITRYSYYEYATQLDMPMRVEAARERKAKARKRQAERLLKLRKNGRRRTDDLLYQDRVRGEGV